MAAVVHAVAAVSTDPRDRRYRGLVPARRAAC
jgi:hypothetical protein